MSRGSYLDKSSAHRRQMLDNALLVHGWQCCICARPISKGQESLQHIKARSKGGTDDVENLRPAHRRCNSALGDRDLDQSLVIGDGEAWLLAQLETSPR